MSPPCSGQIEYIGWEKARDDGRTKEPRLNVETFERWSVGRRKVRLKVGNGINNELAEELK
jgi:hypothetical protein